MRTGIAAATGASNIAAATNAAVIETENNFLNPAEIKQKIDRLTQTTTEEQKLAINKEFKALSDKNNKEATGGVLSDSIVVSTLTTQELEKTKTELTGMISGPTNCGNDPACKTEVRNSVSEIRQIQNTPGDIKQFISVVSSAQGLGLMPVRAVGAAIESGGSALYKMAETAQTVPLSGGAAEVSANQWVISAGASGLTSGLLHVALDPNATPASTAVNVFAGMVAGPLKLGLNAEAGLANPLLPNTVNNWITYGISMDVGKLISIPANQMLDTKSGNSSLTSPVLTCGSYPRKPC